MEENKDKTERAGWLKVIIIIGAILFALALVFGIFCGVAALLMLVWNGVVVGMLAVATTLPFWNALALVAGIWAIALFINLVQTNVRYNTQRWQFRQSVNSMMKDMQEFNSGDEPPPSDLMRHFRPPKK